MNSQKEGKGPTKEKEAITEADSGTLFKLRNGSEEETNPASSQKIRKRTKTKNKKTDKQQGGTRVFFCSSFASLSSVILPWPRHDIPECTQQKELRIPFPHRCFLCGLL